MASKLRGGVVLEEILAKAYDEISLEKEEIKALLALTGQEEINRVFDLARELRQRHFANKVFLYGFIYFSTYCRNNCNFCMYRRSNLSFNRYRKSKEEILETAHGLVESGVHLLDLTMGEDPVYHSQKGPGFDGLFSIVESVKKATGAPLMISPGVVPDEALAQFKNIGVDWYACYQETHNKELYRKLRFDQSYEDRMESKLQAHRQGLLLEEGLLTGVGDTDDDVANSLLIMRQIGAEQVRVMSFISQQATPMYPWPSVARLRELLIIAIMRLLFPGKLIPASLDVDGLGGLTQRLDAGANVVTSIIPPQFGLAGVSQSSLDIDDGNRTVRSIVPFLEAAGLEVAEKDFYEQWIASKKNNLVD